MLKDILFIVENDLNNHKRPPYKVMETCVQSRLNAALVSYNEEIISSYKYLKDRDSLTVLQKLIKKV